MRQINRIIIHCSATYPGMDIDVDWIRRLHKSWGWADVGYHYFIPRHGLIQLGRDLDGDGDVDEEVGAHAKGFNADSLAICLEGGVNKAGQASANFNMKQYSSLYFLVNDLKLKYPTISDVCGHRDLPGVKKACPSFSVRDFFN